MAMHDVWPPTRANAGPGDGVEPRTPQRWTRIDARRSGRLEQVFAVVPAGEGAQPIAVDRLERHGGDPTGGAGTQRRGARATLEQRPLADDRAGPDLGQLGTVDLD